MRLPLSARPPPPPPPPPWRGLLLPPPRPRRRPFCRLLIKPLSLASKPKLALLPVIRCNLPRLGTSTRPDQVALGSSLATAAGLQRVHDAEDAGHRPIQPKLLKLRAPAPSLANATPFPQAKYWRGGVRVQGVASRQRSRPARSRWSVTANPARSSNAVTAAACIWPISIAAAPPGASSRGRSGMIAR